MPSRRPPSYRKHKASGLAVVTLNSRDHYLGPYNSPESHEAYNRLIAEWLAAGRTDPVLSCPDMLVNEVIAAYLAHVEGRYDNSTWDRIKRVCAITISLYGNSPAKDFKGRALKACRAKMIEQGWNRRVINQRTDCLKRVWQWALSEELIPSEAYRSIEAVASIHEGDVEDLPEPQKVLPVAIEVVEATLPYLSPYLADAARLQLAAGMRPGEALAVRADELHQISPDLWLWKPAKHKTAHRGHHRQVYLGPAAIAIVQKYLGKCGIGGAGVGLSVGERVGEEGGYLFSPRRAREERFQRMRESRKTPVQPSQKDRGKERPKKTPGERYRVTSYSHAVRLAAKKAGVEHWHPHQLRHTAGTLVEQSHGIEAARIFLGHRSLDVTRIYANNDLEKVQDIVRQMR